MVLTNRTSASASGEGSAAAPRIFAVPSLLALALALVLIPSGGANAQDLGLPVGAMPPAVQFEDLDGRAVDLSRVIGTKPVVLEFWATWCSLCAELEPEMQRVKQQFGDDVEVVIVAVGVNQNPRTIRRHVEHSPVAGTLVFDRRGAATRAFMAPATSYVVILDATGKVAYTGQGGDQKLTAAVARVLAQR